MRIDIGKITSTPCYYYDTELLRATLDEIKRLTEGRPVKTHYAVKANGNPEILRIIANAGLGADCVSGAEILASIEAGFAPKDIFYAGVGKTDEEILIGLEKGIGCFNIESVEELQVVAELAKKRNQKANIALRINPNIDAHTHHYITTGLEENKFGIDLSRLDDALAVVEAESSLNLIGLHFHIGSQITTMEPFKILCTRVNHLADRLKSRGLDFKFFNVGGGLGIDYDDPDKNPIPDFEGFFSTILADLRLRPGQEIHCELGRSIVGQCGSLISRVIYVKKGLEREYAIIDGGMSNLIRPALYQAHHKIEAINPRDPYDIAVYDVVGPICESSDTFGTGEHLPRLRRGDFVAVRSAGAYGESMASTYNMRPVAPAVFG